VRFLVIALIACGVPQTSAQENPLLAAEKGYLQCMNPDKMARTCEGITKYTRTGANEFRVNDTYIWSAEPFILYQVESKAEIVGGRVCGTFNALIFETASFYKDDKLLSDAEQIELRREHAEMNDELMGKTSCMMLTPSAGGEPGFWDATFYLNGSELRRGDSGTDTIIWIRPEEKYRVGTR
jgi:hypothetical protein